MMTETELESVCMDVLRDYLNHQETRVSLKRYNRLKALTARISEKLKNCVMRVKPHPLFQNIWQIALIGDSVELSDEKMIQDIFGVSKGIDVSRLDGDRVKVIVNMEKMNELEGGDDEWISPGWNHC